MIDFIRTTIANRDSFFEKVCESKLLDLKCKVSFSTGEIIEFPKMAFYKGMTVKISEAAAYLSGSVHKFYNIVEGYGDQNYNDFNYCDFRISLNYLKEFFNISSSETKVTNLEFGINIELSQDPQKIIDNHILMFDYKSPNRDEKFRGRGDYLEFQKTDYNIKIYNKSKQNKLRTRNILRVELKITRSRYLQKHFNIDSLADVDRIAFKKLFKKLLEHFDNLLIVDRIFFQKPTRIDEMILFQNGINPSYWKELKKDNKEKNRFRKDFEELLVSNKLNETKRHLRYLLIEKYNQLTSCDCEKFSDAA